MVIPLTLQTSMCIGDRCWEEVSVHRLEESRVGLRLLSSLSYDLPYFHFMEAVVAAVGSALPTDPWGDAVDMGLFVLHT